MKHQYNFALKELIKGDINRHYSGNYLWIIWSIISPLFFTVVMTMIFSKIPGMAVANYPLYYLTGHIVFCFFALVLKQCITSVSDNAELYEKTMLPKGIFILSRIISGVILAAFSLLSLPVLIVAYNVKPTLNMLWGIPALILIIIFAAGIGCVFAVLDVFGRNLKRIAGMIIVIAYLSSCIFYPIISMVPNVQKIVRYNPLYISIDIVRGAVIYGLVPEMMQCVKLGTIAAGSVLLGVIVFVANKDRILKAV